MENSIKKNRDKIINEVLKYNTYAHNFSIEEQEEASKIDSLEINSSMYKIFLKRLILDKHLKFEDVVDKLPDINLVYKDEKTVRCIEYAFGEEQIPMSYEIVKSLILTGKSDEFIEELYYATPDEPFKAPFTLNELISTTPFVKKRKIQKNIKD